MIPYILNTASQILIPLDETSIKSTQGVEKLLLLTSQIEDESDRKIAIQILREALPESGNIDFEKLKNIDLNSLISKCFENASASDGSLGTAKFFFSQLPDHKRNEFGRKLLKSSEANKLFEYFSDVKGKAATFTINHLTSTNIISCENGSMSMGGAEGKENREKAQYQEDRKAILNLLECALLIIKEKPEDFFAVKENAEKLIWGGFWLSYFLSGDEEANKIISEFLQATGEFIQKDEPDRPWFNPSMQIIDIVDDAYIRTRVNDDELTYGAFSESRLRDAIKILPEKEVKSALITLIKKGCRIDANYDVGLRSEGKRDLGWSLICSVLSVGRNVLPESIIAGVVTGESELPKDFFESYTPMLQRPVGEEMYNTLLEALGEKITTVLTPERLKKIIPTLIEEGKASDWEKRSSTELKELKDLQIALLITRKIGASSEDPDQILGMSKSELERLLSRRNMTASLYELKQI